MQDINKHPVTGSYGYIDWNLYLYFSLKQAVRIATRIDQTLYNFFSEISLRIACTVKLETELNLNPFLYRQYTVYYNNIFLQIISNNIR